MNAIQQKNRKNALRGLAKIGILLIVMSGTVATSVAVLAACGTIPKPYANAAPGSTPPSVTLIGDSLTIWMERQAPLEKIARIKPVGLTGKYTAFGGFTANNLFKLLLTVPEPHADIILIQVGTNDLMQKRSIKDSDALLKTAREVWPNARIVVAPTPPSRAFDQQTFNAWNAHMIAVAKANHCEIAPQLILEPSDYVKDGIHMTPSGSRKMAQRWARVLSRFGSSSFR